MTDTPNRTMAEQRETAIEEGAKAIMRYPYFTGREAEQIATVIAEKIIRDVIRPGFAPEERTCHEITAEIRAIAPDLAAALRPPTPDQSRMHDATTGETYVRDNRTGLTYESADQSRAGEPVAPESTENILLLADAIHDAREAWADSIGTPQEARYRLVLEQTLWNDKGGFAPMLRELAARRLAAAPIPPTEGERQPTWQLIGTAPRDGTICDLLLKGGGRVTDTWWDDDNSWCGLGDGMFSHWMPAPYPVYIHTPLPPTEGELVLHPLSEIREWDEALAELGIQDSTQTPAEAIRELNAEIERLRTPPKGEKFTLQIPMTDFSKLRAEEALQRQATSKPDIERIVNDLVAAGEAEYAPTEGERVALADREKIALRDNLREAWSALAMIRETVETLGPVGAMHASEHLDGPTFMHEAEAIVAGIRTLRSSPAIGGAREIERVIRETCAKHVIKLHEYDAGIIARALSQPQEKGR